MPGKKQKKVKTTKQSIIESALRLFYKRGFIATSVNSIVKKAGVSKGAFYHYFDSKDDILETVTAEMVDQGILIFKKIADDKKLSAIDKLNKIMGWAGKSFYFKEIDFKNALLLGAIIMQSDNSYLFDKFKKQTVSKLAPYLLKIIKQGVTENSLLIPYPEETCQLLIDFMSDTKKDLFITMKECLHDPGKVKLIYRKLKFMEDTINKILGVKPKTISFSPLILNKFSSLLNFNK